MSNKLNEQENFGLATLVKNISKKLFKKNTKNTDIFLKNIKKKKEY